jgi:hypothetical protein
MLIEENLTAITILGEDLDYRHMLAWIRKQGMEYFSVKEGILLLVPPNSPRLAEFARVFDIVHLDGTPIVTKKPGDGRRSLRVIRRNSTVMKAEEP